MPAPVIRKLPTPPNRQNAPAVFAERADAFLGALPQLGEDIDASVAFVNEQAAAAEANAQAAKASENAAAQSRTTAAQSAAASEASRQSALAIAAAVGDDVGLPSIADKPGSFLMVNQYGTGVEFGSNTATQEEAEAGTSDDVLMTPLRTVQARDAWSGAQVFTSSDVFIKKPHAKFYLIEILNGGSGGDSGETGPFSNAGGKGGDGGGFCSKVIRADELSQATQVIVGSGGIGGAKSIAYPGINRGTAGGISSFGSYVSGDGATGQGLGGLGAQGAAGARGGKPPGNLGAGSGGGAGGGSPSSSGISIRKGGAGGRAGRSNEGGEGGAQRAASGYAGLDGEHATSPGSGGGGGGAGAWPPGDGSDVNGPGGSGGNGARGEVRVYWW